MLSFLRKIHQGLRTSNAVDTWLFWILIALVTEGFLIFLSASIGLLAREGAHFANVALVRLFAIVFGGGVAYVISIVHYKQLRRYTLGLLLFSIVLTALVFIPGVGVEHGGARRWIWIFGFSFQPSELLKIAFVIHAAAFFASARDKIQTFTYGLLPLLVLLGIAAFLLLLQPDTDTFGQQPHESSAHGSVAFRESFVVW